MKAPFILVIDGTCWLKQIEQECIPVGCIPPASCSIWWGRGHAWQGARMAGGSCVAEGVCMAGDVRSGEHVWQGRACMARMPLCRQTDVRKLPCPKLRLQVVKILIAENDTDEGTLSRSPVWFWKKRPVQNIHILVHLR